MCRKLPRKRTPQGANCTEHVYIQFLFSFHRAQLLLNSMGIHCPAKSALQHRINNYADIMKEMNKEDMEKIRKNIVTVNECRGATKPRDVRTEFDARYGSQYICKRGEFGRSGTTATGVMVENVTPQKKVIGYSYHSKLCTKGTSLR